MKYSKQQIIDIIILALRFYLAFFMIDYGWGKVTGGQFHILDPKILDKPLKDVDKFYLAWHLFSMSKVFNVLVGSTQIIGGLLLMFNRTVLLGALILIPILIQILLVDIAFTTNMFGATLPLRLAIMLLCDICILYYHKDKMVLVIRLLTSSGPGKFKYKWWTYIIVLLLAVPIDFMFNLLAWPFKILIHWLSK
jgi:uncharacterized membrane protein YphA (DoxX/SURF4 family)